MVMMLLAMAVVLGLTNLSSASMKASISDSLVRAIRRSTSPSPACNMRSM
jgi:F0F1-type ATP synthase membrane subunit c/vacuolar-type H+-ATPase subunit K